MGDPAADEGKKSLTDRIRSANERRFLENKSLRRNLESFLLIAPAAAASAFALIASGGTFGWLHAVAVVFFVVAGVTGFILRSTRNDEDHLEIAMLAKAEADFQRFERAREHDQYRMMSAGLTQLRALYLAEVNGRGFVERSIISNPDDRLLVGLLEATKNDLRVALGYTMEQVWTIVIYKAVLDESDGYRYLHAIAHDRTFDCDLKNARRWREGIGTAGMALARCDEVIAPDILSPEAGSLFNLNGNHVQAEDRQRYRSMCAVPVLVGNTEVPWGVVLATSNEPSHFNSNRDGLSSAQLLSFNEGVRMLAGLAALTVATMEVRRAAKGGASDAECDDGRTTEKTECD